MTLAHVTGSSQTRGRVATAPVKERLLAFLAEHRNEHYSTREIAEAVGCSRHYVNSLLRTCEKGRRTVERELEQFLDACPEAVLPKARGGMTFKEIAAQLGVNPMRIGRLWRQLNLPDRAQFQLSDKERNHRSYERCKERHRAAVRAWVERNPDKARAIRNRSRRRWLAKVARNERCTVCGSIFPWTNAQQQRHRKRGQPIACSRGCAIQARSR